MYRKVIVPLDGSELAEGVLSHVTEVIRHRARHVYLISVSPLLKGIAPTVADVHPSSAPHSQFPIERGDSAQEAGQHIKQELVDYLQIAAKRLEPMSAEVHTVVRFGRPADEILAFVSDVDADLIAMSTHGRSGISRWVFGSVTERVLRGATCPVLLVRAGQAQPRTTYERILVPLDGSELAEQVVPYVKALIHPPRTSSPGEGLGGSTRVFLVSVLMSGLADRMVALLRSYPPGLQLATTARHHAELQLHSYLRSVAAVLREHGAVVHIAIQRGSPADEILAYAAEVEADLITMTTHGLSGMSRWAYGNVAGKVLQGAHSPVLLVRPTAEGGSEI